MATTTLGLGYNWGSVAYLERLNRTARLALLGLLFVSCMGNSVAPVDPVSPKASAATADRVPEDPKGPDPHSYARPHEVKIEHLGLRIDVSFDMRRLDARATLRVDRRREDAPLVLDTRGLEVSRVQATEGPPDPAEGLRLAEWEPAGEWRDVAWGLRPPEPELGQALEIVLPPHVDVIRIDYRTAPDASGLQWLEPEQTADQTDPFLYSQSQAIHARSWIPCQDTPSVRHTFDAVVTNDRNLQGLMAAEGPQVSSPGRSAFWMPQPIPSYLLALAVGRLEQRSLGPRTAVWAEPSLIDAAAREFADVESMLMAGERLYGSYRWGRYDILVLPPAFPFGGMENPRLTFATPTILAGDRSLVSLVAHELAHSWSGNLVTNATWSDLWLNEGFTVYFERRIVESVYGRARADMEAVLGRQELADALMELPPEDQRLEIDLRGRDPDDAMTAIPYEKGALFLKMLEETYGRERFDAFLHRWFDEHAFTSVTTAEFLAFLNAELLVSGTPTPGHTRPEVSQWVFEPGIGPQAPVPHSEALEEVDRALADFIAGRRTASALAQMGWVPQEVLHFLRGLPSDLPVSRLAELDAAWQLSQSGNAEVLAQWLEIAVLRGYRASDEQLERFLSSMGRRKFLMPLYRALLVAQRKDDAQRIYARARPGYHAIARQSLDALLGA